MVSMYPNTQATSYSLKNGVFEVCPPSMLAAGQCPPCVPDSSTELSQTLKTMGFTKFARIVEISGLKKLDCLGITIFAPPDSAISDYFLESCRKLEAVNIVKSSSLQRLIPAAVFCQRKSCKYQTLNHLHKVKIKCGIGMTVDNIRVIKPDQKMNDVIVHVVEKLVAPECMF